MSQSQIPKHVDYTGPDGKPYKYLIDGPFQGYICSVKDDTWKIIRRATKEEVSKLMILIVEKNRMQRR